MKKESLPFRRPWKRFLFLVCLLAAVAIAWLANRGTGSLARELDGLACRNAKPKWVPDDLQCAVKEVSVGKGNGGHIRVVPGPEVNIHMSWVEKLGEFYKCCRRSLDPVAPEYSKIEFLNSENTHALRATRLLGYALSETFKRISRCPTQ